MIRRSLCQCAECGRQSLYPKIPNIYEDMREIFGSGTCDFCHRDDLTSCAMEYIHPIAKDFLRLSTVCWDCWSYLNSFVWDKHKLCWHESPIESIQLALLTALRDCLLGEIYTASGKSTNHRWALMRYIWQMPKRGDYPKNQPPDLAYPRLKQKFRTTIDI